MHALQLKRQHDKNILCVSMAAHCHHTCGWILNLAEGLKKKKREKNQTNTIYGKEWTVWEIACMQRSEETYDN